MTAPQTADNGSSAADLAAPLTLVGHGEALQDFLISQGAVLARDIAGLWTYQDHPDFVPAVHTALPVIIDQHAQAAAAVTAQWYDELAPDSAYHAEPVVDIPAEQVSKSIDWALYAPGVESPQERITASAQRMVMNASRQTVAGNARQEGVAYARFAHATSCAFCRVLATRGAVYSTTKSAILRSDGHKYHDHCVCVPIAVREGQTYHPPAYAQAWDTQYTDATKALRAEGTPRTLDNIVNHMRRNEPQTVLSAPAAPATTHTAAEFEAANAALWQQLAQHHIKSGTPMPTDVYGLAGSLIDMHRAAA